MWLFGVGYLLFVVYVGCVFVACCLHCVVVCRLLCVGVRVVCVLCVVCCLLYVAWCLWCVAC